MPAIITPTLKRRLPTAAYKISKLSTASTHPLTTTKTNSNNHLQTRTMSFFPRFPAGDFTPLFRLLDDYESHRASTGEPSSHLGGGNLRFAPRFDVREDKDAYHLDGELPGIKQKDIDIEFIDSQTLVIKGHTKREYTASSGGEEQPQATGARRTRQPTVEDEEAEQQRQVTRQGGSREVGHVAPEGGAKFWVSERSVGEFSRSFNFPTRVDQEGVKASLKNGILSVVIPKAHAPTSKRITVE
ncbi:hypothetical protein FQN55_002403 [Onygenales sp. PD_40]|nr:hypothetical protein FQN55_002403 [Onygenales sp. PD_40]